MNKKRKKSGSICLDMDKDDEFRTIINFQVQTKPNVLEQADQPKRFQNFKTVKSKPKIPRNFNIPAPSPSNGPKSKRKRQKSQFKTLRIKRSPSQKLDSVYKSSLKRDFNTNRARSHTRPFDPFSSSNKEKLKKKRRIHATYSKIPKKAPRFRSHNKLGNRSAKRVNPKRLFSKGNLWSMYLFALHNQRLAMDGQFQCYECYMKFKHVCEHQTTDDFEYDVSQDYRTSLDSGESSEVDWMRPRERVFKETGTKLNKGNEGILKTNKNGNKNKKQNRVGSRWIQDRIDQFGKSQDLKKRPVQYKKSRDYFSKRKKNLPRFRQSLTEQDNERLSQSSNKQNESKRNYGKNMNVKRSRFSAKKAPQNPVSAQIPTIPTFKNLKPLNLEISFNQLNTEDYNLTVTDPASKSKSQNSGQPYASFLQFDNKYYNTGIESDDSQLRFNHTSNARFDDANALNPSMNCGKDRFWTSQKNNEGNAQTPRSSKLNCLKLNLNSRDSLSNFYGTVPSVGEESGMKKFGRLRGQKPARFV